MKLKTIIMAAVITLSATAISVNAQTKEKAKPTTETITYKTTVECEGCKKEVMESVPFIKGVKDVEVDVAAQTVTVVVDPKKCDKEKVTEQLAKLKLNPEVVK